MSSNLSVVNWGALNISDVNLNNKAIGSIQATQAKYSYFPFTIVAPRNTASTQQPGVWGSLNTLLVTWSSGQLLQVYNLLADPRDADPNVDLDIWLFPEFLIFSQQNRQFGDRVLPSIGDT